MKRRIPSRDVTVTHVDTESPAPPRRCSIKHPNIPPSLPPIFPYQQCRISRPTVLLSLKTLSGWRRGPDCRVRAARQINITELLQANPGLTIGDYKKTSRPDTGPL